MYESINSRRLDVKESQDGHLFQRTEVNAVAIIRVQSLSCKFRNLLQYSNKAAKCMILSYYIVSYRVIPDVCKFSIFPFVLIAWMDPANVGYIRE
jgi:hypothetical protein